MARITREQLNRWNGQAKNGFHLDMEYFLNWGEKTLIKDVKQECGGYIRQGGLETHTAHFKRGHKQDRQRHKFFV